jgi:hypothetical protein
VSDELPDTIEKAIKAWLGAVAFTLVLVGGDMMKESQGERAKFWLGGVLVLVALPIYLSAAWWRLIESKLDGRARQYIIAIASRIPWWVRSLAFVILAFALAQVLPGVHFISQSSLTISATQFAEWPDPYFPKIVAGKHFHNENVLLDGIEYDNCTFENVTLIYNGTAPIRNTRATFINNPRIHTDNPAVRGRRYQASKMTGPQA